MINNLQTSLVSILLLINFCGYSQQGNDTLVQKNRQKVEALMKELENLEKMEKSFSKETDDCEKHSILLSSQIIELQEQLKSNQSEVHRLTSLLSETMSKGNKSCYVVLKSFRKQDDAEQWAKKNNLTGILVKRNLKKTWFHTVMEQQVTISEAGKIVYEKRKNGFADAWWKEEEYFE